jgi:orotidine-5'-phosphate decarboxylase
MTAPRLCVALDVSSKSEADRLARLLEPEVRLFKVGLELYTACGPDAVTRLRVTGAEIFLDLKLHDIPNTVERAAECAARIGCDLLTVHAAGGPAMVAAAVKGARGGLVRTRVLAVTVLTSLSAEDLARIGLAGSPSEAVLRLARLALDAGAEGLVCSPQEVAALRRKLGPGPLLVVPGIRPAGAEAGDQSRVATPADAARAGADVLVVGRPITQAPDPLAAARALNAEISGAA